MGFLQSDGRFVSLSFWEEVTEILYHSSAEDNLRFQGGDIMNYKKKTAKGSDKKCKICFIIMPFGFPFDRYYEAIYAPAALDCGFKPLRADCFSRPAPIMGDIQRLIKEAEVIIAVTTGNHLKALNVLYEIGYAHGKGKTVIIVAEKMSHIPSDLRGGRVLLYDRDDEF
jgi:hypothetical protein